MNLLTFSRLWRAGRAGRALAAVILAISFALLLAPNGQGQTSQASQEQDRAVSSVPASGAAEKYESSALPADKATVYIYRPDNQDKNLQLPIYINGFFVATLEPSTYSKGVTPPGKLVIAALDTKYHFLGSYERNGRWLSLPGCGALDQKRLDTLGEVAERQQTDLALCKKSLSGLLVLLGNAQTGGPVSSDVIRVCQFSGGGGYDQLDLTNCNTEMDGALNFVNQTVGGSYVPPPRITIEVEAGKAYYFRWSRHRTKPDTIELVDSVTGANEVGKLQRSTIK